MKKPYKYISPYWELNICKKCNYTIKKIIFIVNLFFVFVFIWNDFSSHHVKNINTYGINYELYQHNIETRYERILTELVEHPWKKKISSLDNTRQNNFSNSKDNVSNNQSTEEIEKTNELSTNLSKLWNDMIKNIEEEYNNNTDHMDHKWRDDMWNNQWGKYLDAAYDNINKHLKNYNTSENYKKDITNKWIQWAREDIEVFVNALKDEWYKNNNNQNE
ncbi:exported protein (hyp11) [Plasmodium gaboni]|uniref:Exported protein (Hyp11) n=1 Tax=Plasmodium gaboni TaxID=647221 RepID=A0A151LI72_9APIC|nr:exported protein (hyp11) [Plasmodium gaboni]KYN98675.1 exported protein (hyp11) [Plasmodium gaboni]